MLKIDLPLGKEDHFDPTLIEESCVDQFFQEELDVPQFRILDAQRLEHAQVAVFNGHKHRA